MVLEDEEISEETRLAKENAAPPTTTDNKAPENDLSALKGSTRESKDMAYADSAVKNLSQYSETITTI